MPAGPCSPPNRPRKQEPDAGAQPNAALLDYMLPDGNGVELGVEFLQAVPQMLIIVMTGPSCPRRKKGSVRSTFPGVAKAVLAADVMNQIRASLIPASGAVRGGV